MIKLKLGLNSVTNSEYHGDKTYLSSSNLKTLLKDREKFKDEVLLGNKEPLTGNFLDEGSYVHSLILEPHTIPDEYAISSSFHKRGGDWKSFFNANQNSGKILLSKAQDKRCHTYLSAFERNILAVDLVKEGEPEQSICVEIDGMKLKMRADWINVEKGYIADVKTSKDSVEVDSFKMTMKHYDYQLSGALYTMIAEKHYGKPFDFYYLAISKSDLECQVFKTSDETMQRGRHQVMEAIKTFKDCSEKNDWTNPPKFGKLLSIGSEEVLEV